MQSPDSDALPETIHPNVDSLSDILPMIAQDEPHVADDDDTQSEADEVESSASATLGNGTECHIKWLYEGPPKCRCCINWVEQYPDDLRESIEEKEETKAKAIVARMKKSHQDGKQLVLDSIVVQNTELKSFLEELFHGYQGITPKLKKLVLKAPFHPFFFRWDDFKRLKSRIDHASPVLKPYVSLLYELLRPEIQPLIDEVKDLVHNRVITYDLLWAIFPPMQELYTEFETHDRMYIHESYDYKEEGPQTKPGFYVVAKYVDWDGKKFGYRSERFSISPFLETKPIEDLKIYPFHLRQSQDETRHRLLERGKKFRELCAVQHKSYTGMALALDPSRGCYQSISIDGRVMLDALLHWQRSKTQPVPLTSLEDRPAAPELDVEDRKHRDYSPDYSSDYSPDYGPNYAHQRRSRRLHRYRRRTLDEPQSSSMWPTNAPTNGPNHKKPEIPSLKDKELILCSNVLPAYSLTSKKWVILLDIDGVRPITWNEDAFSKLVLPASHKDLVLSFVEAHISGDVHFDDIIEGKGLGLLMLLVGDPGLGKTLTAEAVAEKAHRPLYILSAGELGQEARDVEEKLEDILDMTAKWDAVLLLDECDVFLEERNSARLDHNAIVAVFLRLVEYHNGILIMTTNRASAIDRAFQSRIHLTLRYPSLTADAKTTIWQQFVRRTTWAAGNALTDEHYQRLATLPINGREIKNIVKTAFLLASREKVPLGFEHLKKVVDATMEEGSLQ